MSTTSVTPPPARIDRSAPADDEWLLGTVGTIVLGFALALSAIDLERLTSHRLTIEAGIAASTVALLAIVVASRPTPVRAAAPLLLTLWVGWAATASLGFGPLTALTTAGRFAAVLAASIGLAQHVRTIDPSTLFARVCVVGFTIFVVVSTWLVATDAVDAQVNDRLTLASLESNQLARAAAIAAVAGLWLLAKQHGPWAVIGAGTAVVGGGITLATQSRTGLAALAVAVIILAIRNTRARLVGFALGATLVMAAAWLSGTVALDDVIPATERVNVDGSDSGTTLSGRETLWPQVWDEAMERPIAGHGLGNDRAVIVERLEVGWEPLHAHNIVMHVVLTTGLIGLALLVGAIGTTLTASAIAQRPFELAMVALVVLDGVSEPVVRIPAFGWFALCAAAVGTAVAGQRSSISA